MKNFKFIRLLSYFMPVAGVLIFLLRDDEGSEECGKIALCKFVFDLIVLIEFVVMCHVSLTKATLLTFVALALIEFIIGLFLSKAINLNID